MNTPRTVVLVIAVLGVVSAGLAIGITRVEFGEDGADGARQLQRAPKATPAPAAPSETPTIAPLDDVQRQATAAPPASEEPASVRAGATAPVKIAFIGDQGLGANAEAVLRLIADEGADAVLHQGDFDYVRDPAAWDAQISGILGPDFPYFASLGNHDVCCIARYQQMIEARLAKVPEASCEGALLIRSTCTYRGLYMVFVAPGVSGGDHDAYLRDRLAETDAAWRICSWHMNQRLMQVGGKGDGTGWGAYEECRLVGAIVATAHEHSYSRTHLMSSFQDQTVASTSSTLQLEPGNSFAFVSGIGGHSIRPQLLDGDWWASIHTSDQGANFGALFCTFFDTSEAHASCYFKDIDGDVPDTFELVSGL